MNSKNNPAATNTAILYLYRDNDNYKRWNREVVEGKITLGQINSIISTLNEGLYFIPMAVGFGERKFGETTTADHPWFELNEFGFEPTSEAPTVDITVLDVVEAFKSAKGKWEWFAGEEQ